MVKEVINSMDYNLEVNCKTKMYHANLLKQYFKRDEDIAGVAVQIDSCMAGVAVLDEEDLDDTNLLELLPLPGKESYTDVNISENLTYQQR